jgi:DnaJ domain
VNPLLEFIGHCGVDHAVHVHAGFAGKGTAGDAQAEMGFPAFFPAAMAMMLLAFIDHFEQSWREGGGEFRFEAELVGHAALVPLARVFVKRGVKRLVGSPSAALHWGMNLNSPLFDRVRIRPGAEAPQSGPQQCNHPGCVKLGSHKAPMGRNREGQYFQFCLEHVQEYNKTYNYFNGMSDDAISAYQRDALTGHRPTQPMNVNAKIDPRVRAGLNAEEIMERLKRARAKQAPRRTIGNAARKALDQLGLDETASAEDIKHRFKELVKRFHPDANAGDRSMEDRMRAVIEAYNYLKQADLV